MNDHEARLLLAQEYLHLQKVIEDFDGKSITIKAWSVSFSLVAIGGAFATHATAVLLVASISSLLFWLIEGFWKTFQFMNYARSGQLEEYFRGQRSDLQPFQIGTCWGEEWKKNGKRRLLQIVMWPNVALPHVFVFIIGVMLYALALAGIISV